jgi:hypothetical protein
MPKKIINQQIKEIDGRPCLTFIGGNGAELYFPAQAIQVIFDNATPVQRLRCTARRRSWSVATRPNHHAETWNVGVGITDAAAVAIIVDRGMPSEQTFALTSEHAEALGKQLIQTAPRAGATPVRN